MKWGSVARRGARSLERGDDAGPTASDVWREAVARAAGSDDGERPREAVDARRDVDRRAGA